MSAKKIGAWVAVGCVGAVVLAGGSGDKSSDKPEAKSKPVASKTQPKPSEPKAKPELSETQRLARKIAREFRHDVKPYGGPLAKEVKSFDDDLDPWDNSLAVTLRRPASMYYDDEARSIGAMVLGVGYPLGLCKVDVMGSDHIRIREHESQGRGCIEH